MGNFGAKNAPKCLGSLGLHLEHFAEPLARSWSKRWAGT